MMSQSTDSTQVMPLAEAPQAQLDPDATHEMPIVKPVAPVAPAVPVVPPQPAFDAQRSHLLYMHRVLGRILSTGQLQAPDKAEVHAYCAGIDLLLHDDLDSTALGGYVAVFGGTPKHEDRASTWAESGMQRYAELLTVVDGVDVRVWSLTDLPAAEKPQPAPEPSVTEAAVPVTQPDAVVEAPVETPEAA